MTKPDRRRILRLARLLGCEGTHVGPDGVLMPCGSHEELIAASNRSEPDKRRQRRTDIVRNAVTSAPETLPSGGLVSGNTAPQTKVAKMVKTDLSAKDEERWKEILERHNKRAAEAGHPWATVNLDTIKKVMARGRAYGDEDWQVAMEASKRAWQFLRVAEKEKSSSLVLRNFADWDLLSPDHPARRES